ILAEDALEPARGTPRRRGVAGEERRGEGAVAAPRQAYEARRMVRQRLGAHRRDSLAALELCSGQEAAQGAPALRGPAEQGEVSPAGQGDLRAVERADASRAAGAVEPHGPVEAV